MGDWGSSSNGGGRSVIYDQGRSRSSCGYCKSSSGCSISYGIWAVSLTVDDYQELLDRGWRRSGCYVYKPEMDKTCCPAYTIRLKAADFVPSKEQVRVYKKMQRYIDGEVKKELINLHQGASSSPTTKNQVNLTGTCESINQEEKLIEFLSNIIDEAVKSSGLLPSNVEYPKAVVKKVTSKAKRKLAEVAEDLLYTSNISFQIAAILKRTQNSEENRESFPSSSNIVAEMLAGFLEKSLANNRFLIKACNGHLNFYSTAKDILGDECMQPSKENDASLQQSVLVQSAEDLPCKRPRRLEIIMKESSFDPEEFALYKKYQIKVHNDKPEKVTERSYKRFLVDTPLVFVPSSPGNANRNVPSCGFGSFHQQYRIDGKLVAVGVVDVLPKCLSSKYLFWDPDFSFLSLGKYSALQEINWVKEAGTHCPTLQYYYLGYYIHSCSKMRYKAAYQPSELLCPLRYEWVPIEIARPLLDKSPYVVLSDYKSPTYKSLSPQGPQPQSTSIGPSDSPTEDEDDPDDLHSADVSNVLISVNGLDLKFKDIQRVFGPIDRRQLKELEMQIRRYAKAVGQELCRRMHYAVG